LGKARARRAAALALRSLLCSAVGLGLMFVLGRDHRWVLAISLPLVLAGSAFGGLSRSPNLVQRRLDGRHRGRRIPANESRDDEG
jgi:hypothetical protein